LQGEKYNTKADIWSIGTVFYELIFGVPPFKADSLFELIKQTIKEPLEFPWQPSPMVNSVLISMLVADPSNRIDWTNLFAHEINFYF